MKKTFLIIPAIAILASCGGNSNQNSGSQSDTTANVETSHGASLQTEPATNVAYEVALKLSDKAKSNPPADTASKLLYTTGYGDDEFDLDVTLAVQCYPHSDGGYLALYTTTKEGYLGDGFIDAVENFDAYIYKDGILTPKQDILPKPKYEDFEENDELIASAKKDEFEKECKGEYSYRLAQGHQIKVAALYDEDFPSVFYQWDGSKFVKTKSTDGNMYDVARPGALAGLKVGSPAPKQLKGYQTKTQGNRLIFSNNGNDDFVLTLGSNGVIDTITIVGKRLIYSMCAAGGCNYFGVGFSPVDDAFGMQYSGIKDYFVFKNGVWSRVLENEDGIIEFVTTKDAIKTVKGTEGKIVEALAPTENNNVANSDAKVTLIKIYKSASFCQTCANNSDNDNVAQIRKMYNAIANDNALTKKSIEIEDEESGYPCDYEYYYKDGNLVMVEYETGDGVMTELKIYLENGCPFFCLSETTYPDDTEEVERIYLCNGKIFKYLDNAKKELDVNSDEVKQVMSGINSVLKVAKDNEAKAK